MGYHRLCRCCTHLVGLRPLWDIIGYVIVVVRTLWDIIGYIVVVCTLWDYVPFGIL